jgi:hypothetical protein
VYFVDKIAVLQQVLAGSFMMRQVTIRESAGMECRVPELFLTHVQRSVGRQSVPWMKLKEVVAAAFL